MEGRSSAKALGYRFPAEWEPQEAVWFAWPVRDDLWPGRLERVKDQLAALYALISRCETVRVLCPVSHQGEISQRIAAMACDPARIEVLDYQTDDIWCRDFGPLFLLDETGSTVVIADWRFNAWGDKFPHQARDDGASAWIAARLGLERMVHPEFLEGGAVESNGAGLLLTTEAVLLNPNRNPDLGREAIEAVVGEGLAVDRVLWLNEGLPGDDTDGHVDNLARFFREDGIVIAGCGDSGPAAAVLAENQRRLEAFRTVDGEPFSVVVLPLPAPVRSEGRELPASYLNFLVLNGLVVVPTYGQPESDQKAIEVLGSCFPGREVVGFDCCDILCEGGAVHCLSMQQPATGRR